MRILVGTLYCGENEFSQCCESIRNQSHRDVSQFIVKDRPNKEAHDALYGQFMERAEEADLFIKIDADMVLQRPSFFAEVIGWMDRHPQIEDLQVAVSDFFSDRLIGGLHVFRNSVRWRFNQEQVFVDDWPVERDRRHTDFSELVPAALHCPDPSDFHSFHFGLHKGVKVMQARQDQRTQRMNYHLGNVEQTYQHLRRTGDRRLALACLGAEWAIQGQFGPEHVDYSHNLPRNRLSEVTTLSDSELLSMVQRLRRQSAQCLPWRSWNLQRARLRSFAIQTGSRIRRVFGKKAASR